MVLEKISLKTWGIRITPQILGILSTESGIIDDCLSESGALAYVELSVSNQLISDPQRDRVLRTIPWPKEAWTKILANLDA